MTAEDFGHYLQLRWEWPEHCDNVLVAWRHDESPRGVADVDATTRDLTRGEYDRAGGFRLKSPRKKPHYFSVFAASVVDGEPLYSAGTRADSRATLANLSPPASVSYTLARGVLRRSRLTLTLSSKRRISTLPDLVVVARRGDIRPRDASDGKVLVRLKGLSIAAGSPTTHEFQLRGRGPLYLRALFEDPDAYDRFRLEDPSPKQLKIG